MDNVIHISNTQRGFTRMDNDLYEALIGADLSGRELRVALAVHRLTAGYNQQAARIAASYIAQMAGLDRANVSRIINDLIRQGVIYRAGGSRDPIGIAPASQWNLDKKSTVSKTTHCVEKVRATVSFLTHNKDSKDNLASNEAVAAVAATPSQGESEAQAQDNLGTGQPASAKADRVPYAKVMEIYNRVCESKLPACLKLNEKRKRQIKACWNLEIEGGFPFRKGEFWEAYFAQCLTNSHWIGQNDRGWTADIEFLTRQDKVLKVLEAV